MRYTVLYLTLRMVKVVNGEWVDLHSLVFFIASGTNLGEKRHSWHSIATENRSTTHIRVLQFLYEWHQNWKSTQRGIYIAVARIIVMRNIKGSPFVPLKWGFLMWRVWVAMNMTKMIRIPEYKDVAITKVPSFGCCIRCWLDSVVMLLKECTLDWL